MKTRSIARADVAHAIFDHRPIQFTAARENLQPTFSRRSKQKQRMSASPANGTQRTPTRAGVEQAANITPFHVLVASEFQSLYARIHDDVPEEMRTAVFVRTQLAGNSTTRVDPSLDCQFMFFGDRRWSIAALGDQARTWAAKLHQPQYARGRAIADRDVQMSNAGRCCQIRTLATKWVFCDHDTRQPLLPCCAAADEGPLYAHTEPHRLDLHSTPFELAHPDTHVLPIVDEMGTFVTEYKPGDPSYAGVFRTLPESAALSHRSRLCLTEVVRCDEHLREYSRTMRDKTTLCYHCLRGDALEVTMFANRDRLCYRCVRGVCRQLTALRVWAERSGVACTHRAACTCIYAHALKHSGSVIRLVSLVDGSDAAFELFSDSIYDSKSPIIVDAIAHSPAGSQLARVVATARVPRQVREPPPALRAFAFANDERWPYARMLVEARRVFAQPDAPTLFEVAIRNRSHAPVFGDREALTAAQAWLPSTPAFMLQRLDLSAVCDVIDQPETDAPRLLGPRLDELVYDEFAAASNRRLAFARYASFVLGPVDYQNQYFDNAIFVVAAVAVLGVCEHTYRLVNEERATALVQEMRLEASAREASQRAAEAAARTERKKTRAALAAKKPPRMQKRNESKSSCADDDSSNKSSPPIKQRKMRFAHERVLSRARDPPVRLEPPMRAAATATVEDSKCEKQTNDAAVVLVMMKMSEPSSPARCEQQQSVSDDAAAKRTPPFSIGRDRWLQREDCTKLLGSALFASIFEE